MGDGGGGGSLRPMQKDRVHEDKKTEISTTAIRLIFCTQLAYSRQSCV